MVAFTSEGGQVKPLIGGTGAIVGFKVGRCVEGLGEGLALGWDDGAPVRNVVGIAVG